MDTFSAIVLGGLAVAFLTFVALGVAFRNRSIGELLDRRRNEKWAAQMIIDENDLPEMIAAANAYRRKRGRPEVTLEQFQAQVAEDLRHEILNDARKQLRAKATRRNLTKERRGF